MSAKKAKAKKEEAPIVEEQPIVTEQPVVQEAPIVESQPECLGEGVSRPEPKVDPIDDLASDPTPTKQGKWIKVTPESLASFEAKGVLVGYDPSTMTAKLKV